MTKYLDAIMDVLRTQTGQLTDRQIHYRLVAKGFYPNNRSSYNHLTKVLKDERISGAIPWERIVDSSKPMFLVTDDEREDYEACHKFERAKDTYDNAERTFRQTTFYTRYWAFQPEYIEVWVEKDALARILKEITDKYGVNLVVCKGYQSITNEKDRRDYYHNIENPTQHQIIDLNENARKTTIIYFGDYDPRGENIPQVIVRDFSRLGYQATLDKVALTPEQIKQYNLISAPCKKTDSMASHWIEENGDVAYELDALEPNVLRDIVKQNILKHFSQEAYAKRNEYMKQENAKLKDLINKYLSGNGD